MRFPPRTSASAGHQSRRIAQRITGVSIDRSSGEGLQSNGPRGLGPDLTGAPERPPDAASSLGDCCSAPASRSFDFAPRAEGVAAVEVYKSAGPRSPPAGLDVINIRTRGRSTARSAGQACAGLASASKELSTIRSRTQDHSGGFRKSQQYFADDTIGILVTGSYSRRKASLAQFTAGWREGYLGSENNWGSLAFPPDPRAGNIENRPGPTDVYQVTQNAGYDFTDIDRKRINAQAVLQVKPTDSLSAIVDYTFSQNTLKARTSSIGVWFNHGDTASSWTDGPVAGPNFLFRSFWPDRRACR